MNPGRALRMSSDGGGLDAPLVVAPWLYVLTAVAGGLIVWVSILPYGFLLPVALLALLYVFWSFQRPLAALCTIILLYLQIMERSEGISLLEIGFGLYFYGYLGYWFFQKVFIRGERVVESITDILFLSFMGIAILSVLVVVPENQPVASWFRELLTLSDLLIYFPLRDAMKTERDIRVILWAFLAMAGIVAAINLYEYRTTSMAARYMWELVGDRKAFGAHFFFPAVVWGVSLFLHSTRVRHRLFFAVVVIVFAVALALTFTRGFWIGTILALILLFMIEDPIQKKTLFWSVTIMGVIAVFVMFVFAGNIGSFVLKAIAIRFSSAGSALEDRSLAERVAESRAVIAQILTNPLVGRGFGASFTHFNIIDKFSATSLYIHNGYLWLAFKTGIIGACIFVGFYVSIVARGLKISKAPGTPFLRALRRGSVAVLIAMMFVVLTSNLFRDKESLLVLPLASAILMSKPRPQEQDGYTA